MKATRLQSRHHSRSARGHLEHLEDRRLLTGNSLVDRSAKLNGVDVEIPSWVAPEDVDRARAAIEAISTTHSSDQVYGAVETMDIESNGVIEMGSYYTDPIFEDLDGHGYAIAILDTGFDLDHTFFGPDSDSDGIADRVVYQHDFANDDNDASAVSNFHGTHVASIAAGYDAGVYSGIAPGADLVLPQVLQDNDSGSFSDVEDALQWVQANAATYNIVAVNMSCSDGGNYSSSAPSNFTPFGIGDEIASLDANGTVVIAAAGNSFWEYSSQQGLGYPAADQNVISVGATFDDDVGGVQWYGSSNGPVDNTSDVDRDADDIDILYDAIWGRISDDESYFDLGGDDSVDQDDMDELVLNVLDTLYGDTDLDGDVDSADLTTLSSNWTGAQTPGTGGKGWADGDFDGDEDVDSADQTTLLSNWTGAQASARDDTGTLGRVHQQRGTSLFWA